MERTSGFSRIRAVTIEVFERYEVGGEITKQTPPHTALITMNYGTSTT